MYADSSLSGTTGLITVPTAEALHYKEFNISHDYFRATLPENDTWKYKLNVGTFQNIELGIVGGKVPSEGVYINVKYYLKESESRFPLSLAIGIENLSSLKETSVYMVTSKKLQYDLTAHFGFRALFTETLNPTLMGGINYMFSNRFEFLTDIDGNGELFLFNAGARFYIKPNISFRVFATDIGNLTLQGTLYTFGLSYSKFL